jgi:hypothetical protein
MRPSGGRERSLEVRISVEQFRKVLQMHSRAFSQVYGLPARDRAEESNPLALAGAVFGPTDLVTLGKTFETCWIFVQRDPSLYGSNASTRKALLAHCLMLLGHRLGYDDPLSLGEQAIAQVRHLLSCESVPGEEFIQRTPMDGSFSLVQRGGRKEASPNRSPRILHSWAG